MRSLLGKFLIGTVALAAACSPTATTPTQPQTGGSQAPTEQRSANQVIRLGTSSNPSTLSPEGAATNITLYSLQFDNLLNFDKDFNLKPSAAEKWELLPDASAWRFTLRKDLVFGNGDKATAEDAVNWVQVLLTPSIANTVGRQLVYASGAKVVDPYTFDVTVKQRDYSLPYLGASIFVVSKKALDAAGDIKNFSVATKGAGTGPYELDSYAPNSQTVYKIKSTPHPWRKPIASEVRWIVVPEQQSRAVGLRTGELDVALLVNNPELIDSAKRDGINIDAKPDSYANIAFDQKTAMQTPLANIKVRQALNYAVDKETIARTLYRGYGTPIGQLSVPGTLNYNDKVPPVPFDVAKAKQLLAEAGYPNGFKLQGIDFSASENAALYQAVQDAHRAIGVTYDLVPNELGIYVQIALGQKPRKEMISAGGNNPNGIFSFTWQFLKCDQPPAAVLWCSQPMDALLSLAYAEADTTKRVQLLKDAGKAWADDSPMVFLIATSSFVLTGPKVKGFVREVPAYYTLDSVYRID